VVVHGYNGVSTEIDDKHVFDILLGQPSARSSRLHRVRRKRPTTLGFIYAIFPYISTSGDF
jgi:predicted thioesterase